MKTMIMVPLSKTSDLSVILGPWLKRDPFQHPRISREVQFEFCFAVADEAEADIWHRLLRFRGEHQSWTVTVPHDALRRLFPAVAEEWSRSRFGEIALYRNMLLDEARRVKPDLAVFLDSDIVPPKGFLNLFHGDGKDVCAGVVKTFNNEWKEVLGFGNFVEPFFTDLRWTERVPEETLSKVGFANTACMALGWRVLVDERARFEPLWVDYRGEKVLLSEDHSFCNLLYDLGYEIFLDSRIRCSHLRETPQGRRWLQA